MARRKSGESNSRALNGLLKSLGDNLLKHREALELTQLEVASRSKLAISTVSEIESKRVADVRLSTIAALAEVLGLDDPLKLLKR